MPWSGLARERHERDGDWRTEAHAIVELTNVLVRYVRTKRLGAAQALTVLATVESQFGASLIVASHADALRMALSRKTSANDARCRRAATRARLAEESVRAAASLGA